MTFSIITPSFNQLDLLRLCVASVKDQIADGGGMMADRRGRMADGGGMMANADPRSAIPTLRVEHIIQDAGTTGIEEFARELGADFYRDGQLISRSPFHIPNYSLAIYSERDEGMYDAVNKGLLRATGEICAYLNCDEQYLPGTLGHVAAFFASSPGADVLFGAAIVVRPDGSYLCDRKVSVPKRLHTLVSGNLSIFTSSTFIRKKTVVDEGLLFDPSWRTAGDAVWILRLLEARLDMRVMSAPLSSFAFSGDNLSFHESAVLERRRLEKMAPWYARTGRQVIMGAYRAKRLLLGSYSLGPHSYWIYTGDSPGMRKQFEVRSPTFRWNSPER